ncbi:TetR/AcrR family transcriptional regulator [Pseudidiomarina salilacus]|uniref:TetR/AcrR family transcriptional regulator n=1 Tax=Pseudidiomarina salilacus TaxID=3384452 RepID=UPI003984C050
MAYRETNRVRERKQATQEAILQSALQLLNQAGFAGLQMVLIARNAKVATGTVYRYFPSKEQLCAAVFKHATEIEIAQVEQHLKVHQQAADQRIATALTTFARRALRAPVTAWALIAEPVDPAVVGARLLYRERYANLFALAIDEGIRAGIFPAQDSALSSRALVGAIAEALIGPLATKANENPEVAIGQSIQFCLQALTAKPFAADPAGSL